MDEGLRRSDLVRGAVLLLLPIVSFAMLLWAPVGWIGSGALLPLTWVASRWVDGIGLFALAALGTLQCAALGASVGFLIGDGADPVVAVTAIAFASIASGVFALPTRATGA